MVVTSGTDTARALQPYLPRVAIRALAEAPGPHVAMLPGTLVFADVSGFTRLSERLARLGAEGAERISEAIGTSFTSLLAVAYANGGGLLKFGGDALLLFFEGDDARRARAARRGRDAARAARRRPGRRPGRADHAADVDGRAQRDARALPRRALAPRAGRRRPGGQHDAADGEGGRRRARSCSPRRSPRRCRARLVGAPCGPGVLLRGAPRGPDLAPAEPPLPAGPAVAEGVPVAVRRHVLGGGGAPEHRLVTVAFVRYAGVDALVERAPDDGRRRARRAADRRPAGAARTTRSRCSAPTARPTAGSSCSWPARRARSATRRSGCC